MRSEVIEAAPMGGRATNPFCECIQHARADAVAAHDCIQGLTEMLHGCAPDHPLTAGNMLALLTLVQAYMANVVDGMQAHE